MSDTAITYHNYQLFAKIRLISISVENYRNPAEILEKKNIRLRGTHVIHDP